LAKRFGLTERVKIKVEGSFTNVLNTWADHFGAAAVFGGARAGQVGARVEF
jgi:hypothetical protein